MTPVRRWLVTLFVTLAVVSVPLVPRLLPVSDPGLDTATLLARVQDSRDEPFSALVETAGTLQLPDAGAIDSVGALLGEQNRLRVWWGDRDTWRVDQLLTAGESDLHHDGAFTVEYSYEAQEARVSRDPDIRLPRSSDLVPGEVARRFLGDLDPREATAEDQLSLLPARRVAGVDAAGLRLLPSRDDRTSTISHVDVWADPSTGVPLLAEVWAGEESSPSFTSTVLEWSPGAPADGVVGFRRTPGTDVQRVDVLDIADAASQYAPLRPPAEAGGLARTESSRRAVGVYGTGLRQVVAIPLRDREADPLREQVAATPGAVNLRNGVSAQQGPLGLAVSGRAGDGGWLVAGSLQPDALDAVLGDLLRGTTYLGEG